MPDHISIIKDVCSTSNVSAIILSTYNYNEKLFQPIFYCKMSVVKIGDISKNKDMKVLVMKYSSGQFNVGVCNENSLTIIQ